MHFRLTWSDRDGKYHKEVIHITPLETDYTGHSPHLLGERIYELATQGYTVHVTEVSAPR